MVFGAEVPVDGDEGDLGAGRDVAHLYRVVPAFGGEAHRRVENALAAGRLVRGEGLPVDDHQLDSGTAGTAPTIRSCATASSSRTRSRTAAATSSGERRPMTASAARAQSAQRSPSPDLGSSGVSTRPGRTALTRIPSSARGAQTRVNIATPAFVAEEMGSAVSGNSAAIDAGLTVAPPPRRRRPGTARAAP